MVLVIWNTAYWALNSYALAQQQESKLKQRKYIKIGDKYARTLKNMEKVGSPSAVALVAFLDAERLTCKGKLFKAEKLYRKAIKLLKEGQLYLFEAIACERLALCLRMPSSDDASNESKSKEALLEAWDKFRVYGANMKLNRMRTDYGEETFTS